MSKHAADTASTTKKLLAAGGLAFSLAGFGLFADVGPAVADGTTPDSGSNDEQTNLAQDACWGGIPSPPVTAVEVVGDPSSAGCEHSRVTASYPAGPSYPAASSWPGGNAKP
jgi:hypothetical protein